MSCLKTKLYQKVVFRASQIIMILIQEPQLKSQGNSVLNNNGKLTVNFKEIQVIKMIIEDTKMQRNHLWCLYIIINSCLKDNFNLQQVIKIVIYQTFR